MPAASTSKVLSGEYGASAISFSCTQIMVKADINTLNKERKRAEPLPKRPPHTQRGLAALQAYSSPNERSTSVCF